jgi:hypothetical protein
VEMLGMLSGKSRRWQELSFKARESVGRAASLQARQYGINSFVTEANRLSQIYDIRHKRKDWREYGDIAFHLIATYPPDLAFFILYGFRDVEFKVEYDPVPYILKATEEIYHLRPHNLKLSLNMTGRVKNLFDDPMERAKAGAKLIAREISGAQLSHASGILDLMDSRAKSHIEDELRSFNPKGAEILFKASRAWILTRTGFLRWIMRILFGKGK